MHSFLTNIFIQKIHSLYKCNPNAVATVPHSWSETCMYSSYVKFTCTVVTQCLTSGVRLTHAVLHSWSWTYMHNDNAMPHSWSNGSQNTLLASTLGQSVTTILAGREQGYVKNTFLIFK
jgi:hypothetical protein